MKTRYAVFENLLINALKYMHYVWKECELIVEIFFKVVVVLREQFTYKIRLYGNDHHNVCGSFLSYTLIH